MKQEKLSQVILAALCAVMIASCAREKAFKTSKFETLQKSETALKAVKSQKIKMPKTETLKNGFSISMWIRFPKMEKNTKCAIIKWPGVFQISANQGKWSEKTELHATFDTDKGNHVFYIGSMPSPEKWVFLTLTYDPRFKEKTGIVNLSMHGIDQAPLARFTAHAQFGLKNKQPKDYVIGSGVQGEIKSESEFLYISSDNAKEAFPGEIKDIKIVKTPSSPSNLMSEWMRTCKDKGIKTPTLYIPENPEKNKILVAQNISTFNSLGLYVAYKGKLRADSVCSVKYRKSGKEKWIKGMNLVKDETTQEYRGSLLMLDPCTHYEVECSLETPEKENPSTICMNAKTWDENPPIGKTIRIPAGSNKEPLLIKDQKGKPDAWILYAPEEGKTSSIDVGYDKPRGICVENSEYIIVQDLAVTGGNEMAVGAINSHHVRFRNLDISKWGRPIKVKKGMKKGLFVDKITGKYIYQKFAVKICYGCSQISLETCFIHDPLGSSHCWAYGHPRGPNAIGLERTFGNNVIRNNNVIGSDNHRFDDCILSSPNHFVKGGTYHDTDINGNTLAFSNDDGTELDGGQINVRYWNNRISDTLCGVSGAPCLKGPSYLFRNVIVDLGDKRGKFVSPFKMGSQCFPYNGLAYVFHNTVLTESRAIGSDFWRHREGDIGPICSRNNIYTEPTGSGGFIYYPTIDYIGDYDYDMIPEYPFKIKANKKGMTKEPPGCEENAEKAGPKYKNEKQADYSLAKDSPGIDKALHIPGLNEEFYGNAPDIGAIEYVPGKAPENFPVRKNGITALPQQINLKCAPEKKSSAKIKLTISLSTGNTWKAMPNSPWISCSPQSGNTSDKTQELTISIEAKDLTIGPYRGAVTIRSDKGACRTVFIDLTVKPQNIINIPLKAEKGKLSGGYKIVDAKEAANGKCIRAKYMKGKAEYTFEIPEDGVYFVYAKMKLESRKNALHDSIYASMDNGEKYFCEMSHRSFGKWDWKALVNPRRTTPGPLGWNLKKGKHTLQIEPRSGKMKIDSLIVSSSPEYED